MSNTSQKWQIPVCYDPAMVAESGSYSPSAAKPKAVVAAWQALNLPLDIKQPEPVSLSQLFLAHDRDYVDAVMTGVRANGFGNRSPLVAQSLPWTSGAMLSAARAALSNGQMAVAPCSGFHHAGYDYGGGFCTFNGLMVTAVSLLHEGIVSKVGILDLDQHWGDGTQNIIDRLDLSSHVRHFHPSQIYRGQYRPTHFLDSLPDLIEQFADCDLVLYQAGADPHIDDPLGGWLTTEQLKQRDYLVFKEVCRLGVPIAWNLAGGYQRDADGSIRPVLEIHINTLLECHKVFGSDDGLDKADPANQGEALCG